MAQLGAAAPVCPKMKTPGNPYMVDERRQAQPKLRAGICWREAKDLIREMTARGEKVDDLLWVKLGKHRQCCVECWHKIQRNELIRQAEAYKEQKCTACVGKEVCGRCQAWLRKEITKNYLWRGWEEEWLLKQENALCPRVQCTTENAPPVVTGVRLPGQAEESHKARLDAPVRHERPASHGGAPAGKVRLQEEAKRMAE